MGDADVDNDARDRVGKHPVDQALGDESLVRDDQLSAIGISDGGCPDADPGDGTGEIPYRDQVPYPDRSLEQDDQTGYKIGEDLLQSTE